MPMTRARILAQALALLVLALGLYELAMRTYGRDGAKGTDRRRGGAATDGDSSALAPDAVGLDDESTERRAETTVGTGATPVRASVTVDRSPEEVYALWRDFEAFPRFMRHVEKVDVSADGRRSHWTAKAPAGSTVEWDAILTEDRPNELIAWRALEGSGVHNAGTVRFTPAPAGRGTEVHVEMEYDPPAGAVGVLVAKLFGEEPSQQVRDDVRRFKQVAEVGEVVRSEATS